MVFPFQRFRLKLVRLVDALLDAMEADERYRFTLDGQLATLDDYLEVRPEAAERVRRLVEEGRLAIGPWQVLMDEFLVSGETIVRNLEHGQRRAAEFGGAMPVGYLPDMFGHVAQMPQILRQAGIGTAVVWRGVPGAIDSHSFEWRRRTARPSEPSTSRTGTATARTSWTCRASSAAGSKQSASPTASSSETSRSWPCSAPTTWSPCRS